LKKTVDTFAGDQDTNTTNVIMADVNATIAQQISLNQATSAFATTILSVLNARRRFLLSETTYMNQSAIFTNGTSITGFVYTNDEKKTIVDAFVVYANFLYSFNSNLNSKVSNIQGMIGSLDKCRPPETSLRLLQGPTGQQPTGQQPIGQQPTGQQPTGQQPTGQQPTGQQPTGQQPTGQQPTGQQPTGQQPSSGLLPSGLMNGMMNSTLPSELMNGTLPSGMMNGTLPSGLMNGTLPSGMMNGQQSGMRPDGGLPKGKDGRPQGNIPPQIESIKNQTAAILIAKGGNWQRLGQNLQNNLNPTSNYKPNGGIFPSLLARISGSAKTTIGMEFNKVRTNQAGQTQDYIFYCTSTSCDCSGSCPNELKAITSISFSTSSQLLNNLVSRRLMRILQNTNVTSSNSNNQPPQPRELNPDDVPSSFEFALVSYEQKRYAFLQADMSLSGGVIDFMAPGQNLGRNEIDNKNLCNQALANNNNSTQVQSCRGNINSDCANGMDFACKDVGLYQRLVDRPLTQAALPVDCDSTYTNYSVDTCFNWLERFIIRGTMAFDYKGFLDLPKSIDRSFRGSTSPALRYLQATTTTNVVVDPVTKNDSKAVLPSTLTKMDSTSINVDSSTAVSAPSTSTYLNEFTQESSNISLNGNYLSFSIYAMMVLLGLFL
jgi:hypothetical protein